MKRRNVKAAGGGSGGGQGRCRTRTGACGCTRSFVTRHPHRAGSVTGAGGAAFDLGWAPSAPRGAAEDSDAKRTAGRRRRGGAMCGMTCWPASQDRAITLWGWPARPSCNAHAAAQTATSNHAGRLLHLRQGRVHGSGGVGRPPTPGVQRAGAPAAKPGPSSQWGAEGGAMGAAGASLARAAAGGGSSSAQGWRSGNAQPAVAGLHLTVIVGARLPSVLQAWPAPAWRPAPAAAACRPAPPCACR